MQTKSKQEEYCAAFCPPKPLCRVPSFHRISYRRLLVREHTHKYEIGLRGLFVAVHCWLLAIHRRFAVTSCASICSHLGSGRRGLPKAPYAESVRKSGCPPLTENWRWHGPLLALAPSATEDSGSPTSPPAMWASSHQLDSGYTTAGAVLLVGPPLWC